MADYPDFCEERPFLILDHAGMDEPVLVWFGVDDEQKLPFFVKFGYRTSDNYLTYENTETFKEEWTRIEDGNDEKDEFFVETFFFKSEKDALNLLKTALMNSDIRFSI